MASLRSFCLRKPNAPRRVRLAALLVLALATGGARAQTSSDPCSAAAAYRYPVNGSCVPMAFNKPNAYMHNLTPPGCNSGAYDDAFGNFIATSTLTTVQYTPPAGADAILQVLGACNNAAPLGCSDVGANGAPETVTIATVPGTTYFVRVQCYESNAPMNGTLCIFNPTCLYTLTLYDSFGNGWRDFVGQAYVEIIVGGISLGLWSLNSGYSGYVNFGVMDGQTVQVRYYVGGSLFPGQNSMELTVGGECIYSTYAPPNVAVPYTTIANCTPSAAALPQDCMGGVTICSSESIYDNNATTGCVMDLNASNSGCLVNYERQGSWYYFSPSSSGTLGFTLVPDGPTDDYDFALWGPYTSVRCPNTQPIRCSYFDGRTYNSTTTGMGNGANDTTEGAGQPPNSNNGWVSTLNVVAGMVYVLYVDNWSSTGQAFDLTWNLTNGASLDCTVLPVELLSLTATARDPVIDLAWATATEHNSDHFVVQRSPDNETFTDIGSVQAAGDAQFRTDYLFTDQAPFRGANYYRLLQVDRDGSSATSQTVVAFLGQDANGRPAIFPNPVTDQLHTAFHAPADGPVDIQVLDALGRTAASFPRNLPHGGNTISLPVDGLAKGWYYLRITLPDGSALPASGFLKQ